MEETYLHQRTLTVCSAPVYSHEQSMKPAKLDKKNRKRRRKRKGIGVPSQGGVPARH